MPSLPPLAPLLRPGPCAGPERVATPQTLSVDILVQAGHPWCDTCRFRKGSVAMVATVKTITTESRCG
eukprot:7770776-Pyramimonas_sp.AAC.1